MPSCLGAWVLGCLAAPASMRRGVLQKHCSGSARERSRSPSWIHDPMNFGQLQKISKKRLPKVNGKEHDQTQGKSTRIVNRFEALNSITPDDPTDLYSCITVLASSVKPSTANLGKRLCLSVLQLPSTNQPSNLLGKHDFDLASVLLAVELARQ